MEVDRRKLQLSCEVPDDGALGEGVEGEATYEGGVLAGVAPGEQPSGQLVVRSPATPHPGSIFPPPPPGEPPWLQQNKRPHDQSTAAATEEASAEANIQTASTASLSTMAPSSTGASSDEPFRPANEECNAAAASCSPPPDTAAPLAKDAGLGAGSTAPIALVSLVTCSPGASSGSSSSSDEEEEVIAEVGLDEAQIELADVMSPPRTPPGPPPTAMAPPPPTGPPPSLPIDRTDLKRCVGDSEDSGMLCPDGKRARLNAAQLEIASAPGSAPPQDEGLEASYAQAPPSARWVWDRVLQQEGDAKSAEKLHNRMLQALDELSFGS